MKLSELDRAVLAHVVVDVEAWVSHALTHASENAVNQKIDRWKENYILENQSLGSDYKTRAERELDQQL